MTDSGCQRGGSCGCSCLNCQFGRKREDHCGSHSSGCHLECNRSWK